MPRRPRQAGPAPAPPDGLDPDIPEVVRSQPYSGPMSAKTRLASHLPPLYKLEDIYEHMTKRALELNFDDVLSHLGSRPLRIVTMCSGTESPLLALEMVQNVLRKNFGKPFQFRHLFSAEIVPFKQAYIERNFHPRFLFRDVKQLKDRFAQTAYGSLEKIPKNPDLVIAGFSCVDFSGLNNKRKTLDEQGESGGTFWGIIRYAVAYRPPIVVLENVKTAPWEKIAEHWNEINYVAVHNSVDTKAYYLPQTRERGYMLCIDRNLLGKHGLSEQSVTDWPRIFDNFKRPASSPAGMFLLDADDPRLGQIEKDMSIRVTSTTVRATIDWTKYQARHQNYRSIQELGFERPVSRSQDSGACQMLDFAWQTWFRYLPERIWDTIDVNFLRKLIEGYDMNFKERCIELSQGVEREVDSRAFGIVGCITPSGIPYITTRGGPLCGLEALALQGLPLDRLLLTRESPRDLQDLAGNAMSSTVVGAAVLSALIVGHKVLPPGEQSSTPSIRISNHKRIGLRENLLMMPLALQLSQVGSIKIPDLQMQAASSARYCLCERQSGVKQDILKCTLCAHTACSDCAGNPSHAYERWSDLVRSQPSDFIRRLKSILPARLTMSGLDRESYRSFDRSFPGNPDHVWEKYLDAVIRTVGDELRFLDVRRSEVWTAVYEGKCSILKLIISASAIEWLLFAKPLDSEPALSLHREILSKPIARMMPDPDTLRGIWEVCAPLSSKFTLTISGTGSQVPTYEARCGLQKREFVNASRWNRLEVQGSSYDCRHLEVDILGTYQLLPDCGTASGCLHKKEATDADPEVYLFLDPTKLGEPKNDSFVFALEHQRKPGYESRITIAELSHKWRSSKASDARRNVNAYYRKWAQVQTMRLQLYAPDFTITCSGLRPGTTVFMANAGCHDANIPLVSLSAPAGAIDTLWRKGPWQVTNPAESTSLLRDFAWLLQKSSELSGFQDWNPITTYVSLGEKTGSICAVCTPPKPRIMWGRDIKGSIKAYEDPKDAALYERQVKAKPSPFLIFRRVDEDNVGHFLVTLNVQTLLHKAHANLGSSASNNPSFYWRLVSNANDERRFPFPKFNLPSNRNDPPHNQPPNFRKALRPEQLRSLTWMLEQEKDDIAPFVEEEVEEAILPSMMWRAEGKAMVQRTVRGGVLADDVGYGKTAITLGLIDVQHSRGHDTIPKPMVGFIPTKATLVLVPQIVLQQWQLEITKFVGKKYEVLVLPSGTEFSKRMISDILRADIILVPWSVLNHQSYYERMQRFTGMPRYADLSSAEESDEDGDGDPESVLANVEHFIELRSEAARADATHTPDGPYSEDDTAYEESSTESNAQTNAGPNKDGTSRKRKRDQSSTGKAKRTWDDRKEFNIIRNKRNQQWYTVKTPLLHAFLFHRIVIDEFTYAGNERLAPLLALRARSKWVLSGTPPLNDFADVKTIAPFLGIHLGVDDENTSSQNHRLKVLRKNRSDAEIFQSWRAPHSEAWHRNRHEAAQRFLNQFARRNIANIDEIPFLEHLILIDQSPAECAIYLELYKQLMTHNKQLRRSRRGRFHNDQNERLDEIISSSMSPEEALLKRCCSLTLKGRWEDGKQEAVTCSSLIATREDQLVDLRAEFSSKMKLAAWLYFGWDLQYEKFHKFAESILMHRFGDKAVTTEAFLLFKSAMCASHPDDWKLFFAEKGSNPKKAGSPEEENSPEEAESGTAVLQRDTRSVESDKMAEVDNQLQGPPKKAKRVAGKGAQKRQPKKTKRAEVKKDQCSELPIKPMKFDDFELCMDEVTSILRNIMSEWVLRERALRFLRTVRMLQTNRQTPDCDCCREEIHSRSDSNVVGSCGHALCKDCALKTVRVEECVVDNCRGSGTRFNVISAASLGFEGDQSTQYGGRKMDKLVDIVKGIPNQERAILFIQFPELIDVASKAFDLAKITHTVIAARDTKKIEEFKKGNEKVVILNLGSETAAGLNLQCTNHVIFLSPMLAETQYDYDSSMTQAVGRALRYGQTRRVHVYHLLMKRTIDVNIFQERRRKILVERHGQAVLVNADDCLAGDALSCQGPALVVDNFL
ncbi:DNA repair protein RAD5 [Aspergillus udagawae]|uniref:DNA repair protein RAD5 n=1 Tax=Aspergillus udagawae TaxID=91492 RepID=A0A8H3NCS2_9EURO|nr:DNA repair protein RAD5 [Aspergillus udagawae]